MKRFYKKFIAPVFGVVLWLVLMIMPYCISKPIINWIDGKVI